MTGNSGAALAISYANSSQVYSIPVSGGIDLITSGTGTLTLAGSTSYTGRTVVAAGTLMLTPSSIGVSGFGGTSLNVTGSNTGWSVNNNNIATNPINSNVLTLTSGSNSEGRSARDLTKVDPVNGFTANFTYSPSSGQRHGGRNVVRFPERRHGGPGRRRWAVGV